MILNRSGERTKRREREREGEGRKLRKGGAIAART